MTKEEFYSRALSFDEVGEQVDIFKKEKIKYEQEIERLKSQLDFIGEQNKYIDKLEKLLQQKENIIKEAREYIKDACYLDEISYPNSLGHKQTMKVLEILDKENENDKEEI